jgi:hypothetical protein
MLNSPYNINARSILLVTMLLVSGASLRGQSLSRVPRFWAGIEGAVPLTGSLASEHDAGAGIRAGLELPLSAPAISLTASGGFTHFFQSTAYTSDMGDIRGGARAVFPLLESVTLTLTGNAGIAYSHENLRINVASEVRSETFVHTMPLLGGGPGVLLFEHLDLGIFYTEFWRLESGTTVGNGLLEVSLGYIL